MQRRVYEHKEKLVGGFTKKYCIHKLVYYETGHDINRAITREKQIKAGSRKKKIELIESVNGNGKTYMTRCSQVFLNGLRLPRYRSQ